MPDDFVLNVRQIGQYPRRTVPSPQDAMLVQAGGVGGAYGWINPPDLVSNALVLGGVLHLAPGATNGIAFNGALLTYGGGSLNFSEAFHAPVITGATFAATSAITINGAPVPTQAYVDGQIQATRAFVTEQINSARAYTDTKTAAERAHTDAAIATVNTSIASTNNRLTNEVARLDAIDASFASQLAAVPAMIEEALDGTVSSWNGRTGDVVLTLHDIIFAGGAPIKNPVFEGAPQAPTPWNVHQSDNTIATTEFVNNVVCQFMNDLLENQPFVFTFDGRRGHVTLTTTGFSFPRSTAVTPAGSFRSSAWTVSCAVRCDRSTSMNSGRSLGRQATSISFTTWETIAPPNLTASDSAAFRKCSGTRMWISFFGSTRWKSMCWICWRNGCMV